jgi:hypothetical protein
MNGATQVAPFSLSLPKFAVLEKRRQSALLGSPSLTLIHQLSHWERYPNGTAFLFLQKE